MMRTKGYYSMGLAGYEVEVMPDTESVRYCYISPTGAKPVQQRAKLHITAKGRVYFLANGRRVHLDECIRTDI